MDVFVGNFVVSRMMCGTRISISNQSSCCGQMKQRKCVIDHASAVLVVRNTGDTPKYQEQENGFRSTSIVVAKRGPRRFPCAAVYCTYDFFTLSPNLDQIYRTRRQRLAANPAHQVIRIRQFEYKIRLHVCPPCFPKCSVRFLSTFFSS